MTCGYALAMGKDFLGFKVPQAYPVLYVDGEMQAYELQERLKVLEATFGPDTESRFKLFCNDAQNPDQVFPNLATSEGQNEVSKLAEGTKVIFLDNLSCLLRTGKENPAEEWQPMQNWLIDERKKGRSVIFIHHANKKGGQRGSSKKEDILDTVINLKIPPGYAAEEGSRFIVDFSKARAFYGQDAQSFEAIYEEIDGKVTWHRQEPEDIFQITELLDANHSVREIAEITHMSKSKVGRIVSDINASRQKE